MVWRWRAKKHMMYNIDTRRGPSTSFSFRFLLHMSVLLYRSFYCRCIIIMLLGRHSNVCPSVFYGMSKLLDEIMFCKGDVLKITPVENGDCVVNDDVGGGEGEATASSHTSIDGRETW
ncbi:unnamed protein product [Eruca vesicaria subsp. sativa]|uniref:Uncharacterized protein n=1 Tax=Eruca vesicaria subsp. sativa TaxID=29727 RepID=A0ABC8KGH0_ERUVS|nr:unnamed protein product [Eruca vesicaria subsp. sativa]